MDIGQIYDGARFVLLYTAVAMVAAIAIVGLLVFFFKRERFGDFKKYALGITAGAAVMAVVFMTYLNSKSILIEDGGMSAMLFWPIMATIIVILAGLIAMLVCSLFGKTPVRVAGICTVVGAIGGLIAIIVEMTKYFSTVQAYYEEANVTGMVISAVILALVIVAIYLLGNKRKDSDTRAIVYGAIAIAMSFALSYARLARLPQGGSITFASLLPLMIYCCMFGTRRGVLVCLVYGLLQAVQNPWIIHPMQFLLDYPLAFGMIGISGLLFEKNVFKFKGGKMLAFVLGGIMAVLLRWTCHVLSGVFAFADPKVLATYGSYAAYSMAYNSFAFADMAIALAAGIMLFASRAFMSQFDRSVKVSDAPTEYIDEDDEFDALIANGDTAVPAEAKEVKTDMQTPSSD